MTVLTATGAVGVLVAGTVLRAHAALVDDVPVTPDQGTAHDWAQRELADPVYHPAPNILGWLLDKIRELLNELSGASQSLSWFQIVATVLVVVVVVVAIYVAGPVRRNATIRRSHVVLGTHEGTASDLRAAADADAARGDYDAAVLNGFRAVVRSLEERAVLDPRPGRTAHEASMEAAGRFAVLAERLHAAGRLFDDVCYGHVGAGRQDHESMSALGRELAGTRPALAVGAHELVAPR